MASAKKARRAEAQGKPTRGQRVTIGFSLFGLAAFLALGGLVGPDLPDAQSGQINLLLVLVIGLTAGGLSCLAVQGGLLATAVTQREDELERQPGSETLERNATPILSFLAAKLVAYTLLGALLGWLGDLAAPSAGTRAIVQGATALLMLATALHFLGVHPIFRYAIIQPPRFVVRRIHRLARGRDTVGPALLGFLTVFLPCGVTQAMQLLAINSGSPILGALVMAAFVLGTSPLFFLLGYFATKLGEAAHARFLKFAAVAILFVAVLSLDSALRLSGSSVTLASVKSVFAAPKPVPARTDTAGVQQARIEVGSGGYSPARVQIKSGQPARVTFVTNGAAGCTSGLIFQDQQIVLPQTGEMPIDLPAQEPGSIEYTCTMGMFGGRIEVI